MTDRSRPITNRGRMNHKSKLVKVGPSIVGGGAFSVWAGPCSVESLEQFTQTAKFVKSQGASGLRGGMFKLRTDPRSFQGLGIESFEIAKQVKLATGLPFVSEVTDPRQITDFIGVVDAFQVGSRNMHNYALLKEVAQAGKPVFLKRGFSATFKEWMLAADYLVKGGNEDVILVERGIRTFETSTRNTFDINSIALAKIESPFPVLADPSHATGIAKLVPPMALAAAAAGADGLLIEVHPDPKNALSDGAQSLNFAEFETLMQRLPKVLNAMDRELSL